MMELSQPAGFCALPLALTLTRGTRRRAGSMEAHGRGIMSQRRIIINNGVPGSFAALSHCTLPNGRVDRPGSRGRRATFTR